MKRSGTTLIFVIVWAAVLFASFVIGICIREVRFQYAKVESKADIEPETSSEVQMPDATDQLVNELAQRRPMPGPGGAERPRNFSPEERAGAGGERMARMGERFEGMSEDERQEAIAQMRERFGGRRRGGGERFQNLSEEERAKMEDERRQMRERFENMSEEEREAYRAQMRERFGGRRSSGGREDGRRRSGGSGDGAPPPPKGRACFVAETHVWVDGKLVQISKVTAGQTVGKQFCGSSSLEQVQEHEGTFECRDIALESGNTISVVDAHCFMLDSGRWIAAQNLTSGLRLKTLTGTVGIKSVTKRAVPYTGKVYNLKVKSSDQYMVGKDMVIVRDY
ncbi:MAG: hypothetical protein IIC00_00280 [Planctomycetes bacterium]|nr:hypothetical protein [Planctomycetota bacterium]